MPPRATKNSLRNPINSPLRSPKNLKKKSGAASKNKGTKNLAQELKAETEVEEPEQQVETKPNKAGQKDTKKSTVKSKAKNQSPAKKAQSPKKTQTPTKKNAKTKSQPEEIKSSDSKLISDDILTNAVDELIKYNERRAISKEDGNAKDSLFDEEDNETLVNKDMDLVFQFKKFLASEPSLRPRLINVSHPLCPIKAGPVDFKVCLFIRDNIIKTEAELEKIEDAKIPFLEKIMPLKELHKEYKTFDQKRQLAKSYDLFVSDEGAIANLPALLGKAFYKSAKIPVPIRVVSTGNAQDKKFSIETTKNRINKVLSSAQYLVPVASNVRVKVGNVKSLSKDQLVSNARNIISHFETSQYNDGEENAIRSVYLKLRSSPALPLHYNETLYLSESDVASDKQKKEKAASKKSDTVETKKEYVVGTEPVIAQGIKLSKFEQSLLELGQFEEEPIFLQQKAKAAAKKQKSKKRSAETSGEKPGKKQKA